MYSVLVSKPEGKRQLGRSRRRCEDNNKMDLQKVEFGVMNWMELAKERDSWWALVNGVNEPSDSVKCGEFLD